MIQKARSGSEQRRHDDSQADLWFQLRGRRRDDQKDYLRVTH
jgi:hypothetical protein